MTLVPGKSETDPIAVRAGYWTWLTPTDFFGVPWRNFLGWICISCLTTAPLRASDLRRQRTPQSQPARTAPVTLSAEPAILLIPVLGYGALALSLSGQARALGLDALASWAGSAMLCVCVANLALFARWRGQLRGRRTMARDPAREL